MRAEVRPLACTQEPLQPSKSSKANKTDPSLVPTNSVRFEPSHTAISGACYPFRIAAAFTGAV